MIRKDYTQSDIITFRNKLIMTATGVLDKKRSLAEVEALVSKQGNKCYELLLNAVMSVEPTLSFNEFKSLTAVIKVLTEIMNGTKCCDIHVTVNSRQDMVNHILQSIR